MATAPSSSLVSLQVSKYLAVSRLLVFHPISMKTPVKDLAYCYEAEDEAMTRARQLEPQTVCKYIYRHGGLLFFLSINTSTATTFFVKTAEYHFLCRDFIAFLQVTRFVHHIHHNAFALILCCRPRWHCCGFSHQHHWL
jgi:hypothetical protein